MNFSKSVLLSAFLSFSGVSFAQMTLTNASPSNTITFASTMQSGIGVGAFNAGGFEPATTTSGRLNSNAWAVTGWSDGALTFGGTRTTTNSDYTRGATSAAVTTGGFFAYTGSPQSVANPCLMIQPGGSDFAPGTITLRILNNGTTNITAFDVAYNIFVRNDQGRSSSFNFSWSTDNSTYTSVASLDYTTTAAADALGWVQVGASPSRSTTISGLTVAPGAYFYIRWSSADVAGSGSRDEIGLDDIAVTATFSSSVQPNLTLSVATLNGFSTIQGTASASQSYTLSGSNLSPASGNITVTAPTGYEVSADNTNFSASLNVPYNSSTLASTTLYTRIAATASAGAVSGNISHSGGGATTQNVAVSGTVSAPTLLVSPNSLFGFTAVSGGASSSQSYTLSGSNLSPASGNITVTAPTGYEVSADNTSFSASLNVPYSSSTLASTTLYTRIAATATVGAVSGNISHSGGGATAQNVAVSGQVNGNFTQGNLLVIRADGSASNTTATVLEILPNVAAQGVPVQSISIPGTGPNAIRVSGTATSTLYASQSNDGTLFTFTGHNSTDVSSNSNALLTRAVVTLNNSGTINLATTFSGISGNQIRSATSLDNTNWAIADQAGIYTNNASAPSPAGNYRKIRAFGGKIYVGRNTTGATDFMVNELTGIGGTINGLPGLPSSASFQDFYFIRSSPSACDYDILYVVYSTTATAGTIEKFSLVSGTWVSNGTYTSAFGGFGLTAERNGSGGAFLYVTTGGGATTANSLRRLTDANGFNAAISITDNIILYTAPAGTILKGVDFTPVSATSSPLVSIAVSPVSASESNTSTVTVTVSTPNPVISNQTVTFGITGTNVSSSDFGSGSLTGTATILAGQSSGTATLQIADDVTAEGNELANVRITGVTAGLTFDACDAGVNFTIVDNDYSIVYSQNSGNAFSDPIWDVVPAGTGRPINQIMGQGRFNGSVDVVIQNGHTVNWTQTDSVKNLIVENGALLRRNNAGSNIAQTTFLRVFGSSVMVNGQLGETVAAPNFDALGLDIAVASCNMEGTGIYTLARLRNAGCVGNCSAVIKRNLTLTYPGAVIYAEQNDANFHVTIDAGVTVNAAGTASNADVAIDGTDGASTFERGGSITVNGLLTISNKLIALSNNLAAFPCSINIGASGRILAKDADIRIDGLSFTGFNISAGGILEINGALAVKGGTLTTNGGVIINHNAMLLHGTGTTLGGGEVSGNVIVKRNLPTADRFHYIGSPVNNVAVNGFGIVPSVFNGSNGSQMIPQSTCDPAALETGSPWANLLELREDATVLSNCSQSLWHVKSAGTLENARGYAAMAYGTSTQNLSFDGTVNNGTVTYTGLGNSGPVPPAPPALLDPFNGGTLIYRGWHMVSNPYPSPITFGANNGTLTGMGFDAQVQVWNSALNTWVPSVSNAVLPVAQGFQIRNSGSSPLSFTTTNAMRTPAAATFYDMPWEQYLTVTLENNTHNMQTVIFFHEDATDGYDGQLEANRLFGGTEVPVIYTLAANGMEHMAFNGYAPLYNETKTVPMGVYDGGAPGSFSLRFQDLNTLINTAVTLEDTKLNTFTPVNEDFVYNFTTQTDDETNRFRVHFNMLDDTQIGMQTQSLFSVFPNPAEDMIHITFTDALQGYTLQLRDLSGKTLLSREVPAGTQNVQVGAAELASGVYLLEVRSDAGERNVVKLIRK